MYRKTEGIYVYLGQVKLGGGINHLVPSSVNIIKQTDMQYYTK